MEKEYKDYLFHFKCAALGTVIGLVVALLSGLLVHAVQGILSR